MSQDGDEMPRGALFSQVNKLRDPEEHASPKALREKYNKTIFGKLAQNPKFEATTMGVICFNALFIGYDADYSARYDKPEYLLDCPWQFIFFENAFAVYFTVEVLVRMFAVTRCCYLIEGWFVFDSVLVTMMIAETWVMLAFKGSSPMGQLSVLRLLRLLRITRMAKLMRQVPELRMIVKGLLAAVRSVMTTFFLLIAVMYVFSIVFTSEYHWGNSTLAAQNEGDNGDKVCINTMEGGTDWCTYGEMGDPEWFFGTMGRSMQNLLIMGTILDDITACTNAIRGSPNQGKEKGTVMIVVFIIYLLIASFTMLNMLIGIICEVVTATQAGEQAKDLEAHIQSAISWLFQNMDSDKNGVITRDEFMSLKDDKEVSTALKDLKIRAKHFEAYAQLAFAPGDDGGPVDGKFSSSVLGDDGDPHPVMSYQKTIDIIMRLRPGTKVSALDFASFSKACVMNNASIKRSVSRLYGLMSVMLGEDFKVEDLGGTASMSGPPDMFRSEVVPATSTKDDLDKIKTAEQLDGIADEDIILELQRRVGMSSSPTGNRPAPQAPPGHKMSEVFESLCMPPQPEGEPEAWSKETYTC